MRLMLYSFWTREAAAAATTTAKGWCQVLNVIERKLSTKQHHAHRPSSQDKTGPLNPINNVRPAVSLSSLRLLLEKNWIHSVCWLWLVFSSFSSSSLLGSFSRSNSTTINLIAWTNTFLLNHRNITAHLFMQKKKTKRKKTHWHAFRNRNWTGKTKTTNHSKVGVDRSITPDHKRLIDPRNVGSNRPHCVKLESNIRICLMLKNNFWELFASSRNDLRESWIKFPAIDSIRNNNNKKTRHRT